MSSDKDDFILKRLTNKFWRLTHLYRIKNKLSNIVTFKPNAVQDNLYQHINLKRLVIPKARQHGITTAVSLHFLDACISKRNQRAAIIAHRESDAKNIFASKIKFPFEHMDPDFKQYFPSVSRCTNEIIEFDNGSSIYAATMVRSDTLSHLHISELGKMSAWYPVKAEEVRTGAFPAAEKGQTIIESTMEGNFGLMAEISNKAYKIQESGISLGDKDFKLLFYPWWQSLDYQSKDVSVIKSMSEELVNYFLDLEEEGIILTDNQKSWYKSEYELLGWRMRQEYPSTYKESLEASNESSFFGKYIAKAKLEGRICHLPYDTHARVYASFDIGIGDQTAIWIFQLIGREIHFIDFMQSDDEDISYYMSWLSRKPYAIDRIILPHDAGSREKSSGLSYENFINRDYEYKTNVLERDAHEILGIECAWQTFPNCFFDQKKCADGIESLTFFSRQYDRVNDRYLGKSIHDKFSDGAKSFIYACESIPLIKDVNDSFDLKEYRALKNKHRKYRI